MAIKKYYDSDCNLGVLDGKTVAVIGFGSQGHAHSENLAESGVNVVVGLRKGSAHWEKASEFAATHDNFKVMEVEEAAKAGDVVMMLVPDELCADIYNKQVAPYMTEGKALAFAQWAEPLRRPTTTFTPLSARFSEWAWPWLPKPMTATVLPSSTPRLQSES